MTIKDILTGYGVDFASLTFNTLKGSPSMEEIKHELESDEIIVDGSFIRDFELYADEPYGFIELYWDDDLANKAEGACAGLG